MNKTAINTLKILRKIYVKITKQKSEALPDSELNPDTVSNLIYKTLIKNEPSLIARFGSTELTCLINYLSVKNNDKNYLDFIKGDIESWWWNPNIITQMQQWSGFFPPTLEKIEEFCELMLRDIPQVDILGSWLSIENRVADKLKAEKVHLRLLEPFWAKTPWTTALKGKKVLVVHPFNETIESQYKKRSLLFDKDILPEFELITIQAVQSLGTGDHRFADWFEALKFMQNEIDKTDYDICLIGAGAYGFPLAAHVKRTGKKAIHMGGSLQLLFGIKGRRWEDPNYGVKEWGIPTGSYSNLMNEHWVRPGDHLKPKNAQQVEGACYW
ncbi:hypothetical protein [Algibacter lectus]|uniref:hypothetical protein n=1 Tax=Algibacter lectus TaxID=221126 RepID=UPI0024955FF8|nr:hypothetical protein [Algibacter lectus]